MTIKQFNFPEQASCVPYPLCGFHPKALRFQEMMCWGQKQLETSAEFNTAWGARSTPQKTWATFYSLCRLKGCFSICANSSVKVKYCVYSEDNKRLSVDTGLTSGFLWTNSLSEREIKSNKKKKSWVLWLWACSHLFCLCFVWSSTSSKLSLFLQCQHICQSSYTCLK